MTSVWLAITAVGVVAGGLLLARTVKAPARAMQRRRREMRLLAPKLGLRYFGSAGPEAVAFLPEFALSHKGHSHLVANLIGEERRPPRVLLFDYCYTHSAAPRDPRPNEADFPVLHLVAMAALRQGAAVTPVRVFLPSWFGPPPGVRGAYSLQFADDPSFSAHYTFLGEPREAVRRMLTAPVREALVGWLLRGLKPTVEVVPGWAIAFVESEVGDKGVGRRASALLAYVTGIARALGAAPAVGPAA